MNLELEYSKAPIFGELDALKKQIDDQRPLPPDVEGRVMQKLRLDWNYNSNAIEGNKLTYGETVAFLMEGITAKGKPLKDHLDIRGHNEAIHFLTELVKDGRGITETDIRALHKMILVERYKVDAQTADGKPTIKWVEVGEYKTMANHVQTSTGEIHYYASPEEVPIKMQELTKWYQEATDNKKVHPIVIATLFHHKFVSIHPFDDGNGRLSRILMNLILMGNGFPPAIVKMDDRKNYYSLLSRADSGDNWPFLEYISERVENSLKIYIKALNGEDVEEDEDIDKEIALFKMELDNDIDLKHKKSFAVIEKSIKDSISIMLAKLLKKLNQFDDLFFDNQKFVRFRFIMSNGSPSSARYNLRNNDINSLTVPVQNMTSLECYFIYKDFKKSKNMFSTTADLKVFFEEYNYVLFNSNEKITKFYHEKLTDEEIKSIVKNMIKTIIDQIKEKVKSV